VTVVDLIRRQQGPVRIPSAQEAATVQLMDDLLGLPYAAPEPQRGWLAKGAKLAGLALGSLALCGSVYAASTLTHRPAAPTGTALDNTVLTGVGALRPDKVAAQLSGTTPDQAPAEAPAETPAPVRHAVQAGPIATGRATGTVVGQAAPTTTAAPPPAAKPISAAQVVKTFYQLVATSPGLAAQLLSPSLLAGESTGFDRSWHSLRDVDVESVDQTGADTVQAVVRLREADGTWLRVVELLHVTGGNSPLISGAELLSAQHG
jgi:hypothetical protein